MLITAIEIINLDLCHDYIFRVGIAKICRLGNCIEHAYFCFMCGAYSNASIISNMIHHTTSWWNGQFKKKSSFIFMCLLVCLSVLVKQKEVSLCVRRILPATGIVSSLEYLSLNESLGISCSNVS